jgi:hypothetical protein
LSRGPADPLPVGQGEQLTAIFSDLTVVLTALERGWAVIGAPVGLLLGHRLATSQAREERKRSRITRQIDELYSPLLGLFERALALAVLRTEVSAGAERAWRGLAAAGMLTPDSTPLHTASYNRIIEYNNEQLREEILPLYREMLTVFTRGYGLAEPSTRDHFATLVKFDGLWRRSLANTLPNGVLQQLPTPGPDLDAFHSHLVATLDRLRASI